MRPDLERRLARAEISAATISWADRQAAQHRCSLRTRVKICDGIREYLIANGIEPELDALVQRREEAAVELANTPDTRELRASDEAILSRGHSEEHRADALRKIEKMLDQTAERMEAGQRLEVIDTASTRA
jgi:hypothetical protein